MTGTVVRIRVLVVTKMRETAVILIRDEGRTLTQLEHIISIFEETETRYETYKSGSWSVAVKLLGMGATTVKTRPASRVYFPFMYSSSFPVPIEATNPIAPMGRKRTAVSPAESLSTCCAIRTM